jgi:hypothetical protein
LLRVDDKEQKKNASAENDLKAQQQRRVNVSRD